MKQHCEQAADGHKLPYLLINPVQRIPRYSLLIQVQPQLLSFEKGKLFQELLKKTDQAHPDYENLSKAMDELKNFTKNMNETYATHSSTDTNALSVRMTENTKVMDMIKKSKSYVGFEVSPAK